MEDINNIKRKLIGESKIVRDSNNLPIELKYKFNNSIITSKIFYNTKDLKLSENRYFTLLLENLKYSEISDSELLEHIFRNLGKMEDK